MDYINNLLTLNCLGSGLPPIISSDLNFRVIGGTTQPENPQENDIWINTDVGITKYYFRPDALEPQESGDIWIKTGQYSLVPFNAIRKNGVYVYPVSVFQYNGLTWKSKNALIYQGGDWKPISSLLFDNGAGKENWSGNANFGTQGTFSIDDTISVTSPIQNGGFAAGVYTKEKIDFTDISTVKITANSASGIVIVYLRDTQTPSIGAPQLVISSTGVHNFDVSAVAGQYYIIIVASSNNVSPSSGVFSKIELE